jgi:hypothetical protein
MGCTVETMISAGLLLISFMLMVLNIYLDHGYEDEHHLDIIYIYYSLELEFNMKIMDGIVRIMVTVKSVER